MLVKLWHTESDVQSLLLETLIFMSRTHLMLMLHVCLSCWPSWIYSSMWYHPHIRLVGYSTLSLLLTTSMLMSWRYSHLVPMTCQTTQPYSVGWYHRLCATVSTVKKYRDTRYYCDGTFAITSTDRPAGIARKFRGMGNKASHTTTTTTTTTTTA